MRLKKAKISFFPPEMKKVDNSFVFLSDATFYKYL